MQVDVIDIKKKKVGTAELPDDVFASEVSEAVIWEQVKAQLASRRRGTHKTKRRGEVSGGGIKPYKQKHTGRARQGSIRSPQFVGGGTVWGPQPRDYSYRLPRGARKAALKSALSMRAKDGLVVVNEITLDAPKTKVLNDILEKIGVTSALIVDGDNRNLQLSARNLPKSKYVVASAINVYDILGHQALVLTQGAIDGVVARARRAEKNAAAETEAAPEPKKAKAKKKASSKPSKKASAS
jgi:large subunit ribosomal protein L4